MEKKCKICGHSLQLSHAIKGIQYYRCPQCHFLQNFHWEEHPARQSGEIAANKEARDRLWLPGANDKMRQKGWEMMELMVIPPAWFSRRLHQLLNRLPGYRTWVGRRVKKQLHRLLDFGCGHGEIVLQLARGGFDIVGLDPFSPTADTRIIRQELIPHAFPANSFDGIFTIETMEHIPNVLEIFRELHRILKPGGVLLVQTRRVEDPNYIANQAQWFYLQEPGTHVSIYSQPAMARIAQATGFKNVSFRGAKFARFIK